MTKQEEEDRIAAAVQKQLEQIMMEQQAQFSKLMEKTMKDALKGVDKANAALNKERQAVIKELDAAQKLRAKAEREGEKMAQEFFEGKQKQFTEAAKTELLRDLVRMHIEVGKSTRDIAVWLDVPMKFVEDIRQLLKRVAQYSGDNSKRVRLEGNPKLRYVDMGRGGTIYYESPDAQFDIVVGIWWRQCPGHCRHPHRRTMGSPDQTPPRSTHQSTYLHRGTNRTG
jgi:hypothetical protein